MLYRLPSSFLFNDAYLYSSLFVLLRLPQLFIIYYIPSATGASFVNSFVCFASHVFHPYHTSPSRVDALHLTVCLLHGSSLFFLAFLKCKQYHLFTWFWPLPWPSAPFLRLRPPVTVVDSRPWCCDYLLARKEPETKKAVSLYRREIPHLVELSHCLLYMFQEQMYSSHETG